MRRLVIRLGALCLLWVGPAHGTDKPARNAVFALIMGVNRSVDADLKTLLYADDDAVRYQELFRALGARTQLLARLDHETTALSPQAAAEALPPTRASLRKVVAQLASEIALAHERGVKTTLYVLYAGHGNVEGDISYLTLEDARLSGDQLAREILDPIAADENHLIVDACYSYLLVGERGPGESGARCRVFPPPPSLDGGAILGSCFPPRRATKATSGEPFRLASSVMRCVRAYTEQRIWMATAASPTPRLRPFSIARTRPS